MNLRLMRALGTSDSGHVVGMDPLVHGVGPNVYDERATLCRLYYGEMYPLEDPSTVFLGREALERIWDGVPTEEPITCLRCLAR